MGTTIAPGNTGRQHEHVSEQHMERFVRNQLQAPETHRIDELIDFCPDCHEVFARVADRVMAPKARRARAS